MEISYRLPYVVYIDEKKYNMFTRKQMWKWCAETFGNDKNIWSWDSEQYTLDVFLFNDVKHANWFILRWK